MKAMKKDNLPEEEYKILLSSLRNPAFFEKIVDNYQEAFFKKAISFVGEEYAYDMVQEAFVKMYLNADKFERRANRSFSSWAYKILINTCLSHYRKHKKEKSAVSFDENMFVAEGEEPPRESYKERFLSALSKVPENTARVLRSLVIDGRSPQELATLEGISYGNMRVRIHRARRVFKKVLSQNPNL